MVHRAEQSTVGAPTELMSWTLVLDPAHWKTMSWPAVMLVMHIPTQLNCWLLVVRAVEEALPATCAPLFRMTPLTF